MRYLLIVFALFFFAACGNTDQSAEMDTDDTAAMLADFDHFGEAKVVPTGAIPVSSAILEAEKHAGSQVTLEGEVKEVCQMKGCWMTLVTGEDETIRVTFKDYGFFVPKDIAGQSVVLSGEMRQDTVAVDVLKHYAEEAGKPQAEIDSITETEIAWAIIADGVLVRKSD